MYTHTTLKSPSVIPISIFYDTITTDTNYTSNCKKGGNQGHIGDEGKIWRYRG